MRCEIRYLQWLSAIMAPVETGKSATAAMMARAELVRARRTRRRGRALHACATPILPLLAWQAGVPIPAISEFTNAAI